MSKPQVRTRFAPSPTGALHLGNVRTALFNWLYARAHGGACVLRSEDTDATRSDEAALGAVEDGLAWLGLDMDEGPSTGGQHGPYRQSERQALYRDCLDHLLAAGQAFHCYCTREELAAARERQLAAGQPPRYPGTCRDLDAEARGARAAEGRVPTIRFRVPDSGSVTFDDGVVGRQTTRLAGVGDFVIARSDGGPAFFLANAVDDAHMGITHVLRGEDHLTNTPRQLLLLEALGLPAPAYAHFSLLLGGDGRPLSKREGGATLEQLRQTGYLPAAVLNHLARIGFTPAEAGVLSPPALAQQFDLDRVAHGGARHDPVALDRWQRLVLDSLDNAAIWAWLAAARPADAVALPVSGPAFAAAVRANVLFPEQGWAWAWRLFAPEATPDADAGAEIAAAPPELFHAALRITEPAPGADFRGWARAVGSAAGVKGRGLFRPLRAALTNAVEGPEMGAVVPLLPETLIQQRLRSAARP